MEDDRESNGFMENEQDEVMEDVEELANEPDNEQENELENEEEEAEEEEDGEADNTEAGAKPAASSGGAATGGLPDGHSREANGTAAAGHSAAADGTAVDSADTMAAARGEPGAGTSAGATAAAAAASAMSGANSDRSRTSTPLANSSLWPRVRPEAQTASLYDIVPTMAAPQATSINALAVTPDLRYWMTGGSDGYIRKYDGPGTINGKQLLTVAQRHPFVDSVVKAGILMSYWENEEPTTAAARGAEEHILSPVYSLAVHSRALWLLAGTEGGGINLQSVRHDEGKRITCLQRHSNAVSVLQLAPDEKSVLSGSWDKNIFDWDLNNGQIRRHYDGSGGQISALELRPASGAPIPASSADDEMSKSSDATLAANNDKPLSNGVTVNGIAAGPGGDASTSGASATVNGDDPIPDHESLFGSPGGSLFGGSDAMGGNPFGDDDLGTSVDITAEASTMPAEVGSFSQDVDMVLDGGGPSTSDIFGSDPAVSSQADAGTGANAAAAGSTTMAGAATDGADGPLQLSPTSQAIAPVPSADGAANAPAPSSPSRQHSQQQSGDQPDSQPQPTAQSQLSAEAAVSQPQAGAGGGTDATAMQTDPQETAQPDQSADITPKQEPATLVFSSQPGPSQNDPTQVSETTFFSASMDGTIRIWDRRQSLPIARIGNRPGVPPWCMGACWSPDGNTIYAGRRNGVVEEFDIHKARSVWQPERTLKFPAGSGPVSAVRAMANGRHLVCASHDILRLYDLQDTSAVKGSSVPFLIIPGPPRAGVISHLYVDRTSRFMISTAGTRGWEGTNTEVLIGYEINSVQ